MLPPVEDGRERCNKPMSGGLSMDVKGIAPNNGLSVEELGLA